MSKYHNRLRLVSALAAVVYSAASPAQLFYRLESAVVLKGAAPRWDYLALDPTRPYLFIGRRGDGLAVFDVATKKTVATIEDSKEAGAVKLVPEFDLGYTANEDGTTTMFTLSSLKTIKRIEFGKDCDSVFYEPVSNQLVFTMGDSNALGFVDARNGTVLGKLDMGSHMLEGSAPDGNGNMFVAERDKNRVAKVDVARRKVLARWPTDRCSQPTGLAFDRTSQRIFVGCGGEKPVLAVIDATSGKVVATQTIGRGNDGVVFDAETRKVYTSNGIDANLVIYYQVDADTYRLAQAVTTRPYARTMALDSNTKNVYTVTAEGVVDPAKKINAAIAPFYPNKFYDDTLTVLTYSLK